jgi:hypothetical protein
MSSAPEAGEERAEERPPGAAAAAPEAPQLDLESKRQANVALKEAQRQAGVLPSQEMIDLSGSPAGVKVKQVSTH